MHVIWVYVHCFTTVMRYHDARTALSTDTNKKPTKGGVVRVLRHLLFRNKRTPRLEALWGSARQEIERGFAPLRRETWESPERQSTVTMCVGASAEEQ